MTDDIEIEQPSMPDEDQSVEPKNDEVTEPKAPDDDPSDG